MHRLQRTSDNNSLLWLPLVKESDDMKIEDKREPKSVNVVPTREKYVSC